MGNKSIKPEKAEIINFEDIDLTEGLDSTLAGGGVGDQDQNEFLDSMLREALGTDVDLSLGDQGLGLPAPGDQDLDEPLDYLQDALGGEGEQPVDYQGLEAPAVDVEGQNEFLDSMLQEALGGGASVDGQEQSNQLDGELQVDGDGDRKQIVTVPVEYEINGPKAKISSQKKTWPKDNNLEI